MASKKEGGDYKLKLNGPGHTFERDVDEDTATKIITFVMGGAEGRERSPGGSTGAGATPPAGKPTLGGQLTPKQFLAQKRPGSNYERVACLAYYLGNYRDMPHFKTRDITKLNTESAHTFTNPATFVNHATKTYHFLSAAGGGKKQITTLGEAVVEALPDRAAVAAAIAEHKPARKRAKRKPRAK